MKMNDYNATLSEGVLAAITGFEAGTLPLGGVQAVLQNVFPLLENDGSGIAEVVRLAEADLEEIQFTVVLEQQRPAAILRLAELRSTIEGADEV